MLQNKQTSYRGVFTTMVTPYRADGSVDYKAAEKLVDWYIRHGVDGIFAICQSSERELLTRTERAALGKVVVEAAEGRVPVVVSGHISDSFEDQLRDYEAGISTGCDGFVLVSNRFAEGDFKENLSRFLEKLDPGVSLGIYECPAPFRRLLSPEELSFAASTGRFAFFKDTCCNPATIRERVNLTKNTGMAIFNANAASLLQSLLDGAAGYSGVMANFHPELYGWLCNTKHQLKHI